MVNHGREKKGSKNEKKKKVDRDRLRELSEEMKYAKNNKEIPAFHKSAEISVIYPVQTKPDKD